MKQFLLLLLLATLQVSAQDNQQPRAFPITDYMVDLNDSIKLVQLQLPDAVSIPEKKLGLLKGIYRSSQADTATIGAGRCQLIKGDYYYFAINHKKSGLQPRAGDLLYVMMDKPDVYTGLIPRLAAHYIGLKDVYEKPQYNRYAVFSYWKQDMEDRVIDTLVADIRFTGDYFLKNDPSMNVPIKSGSREGKLVLNTMISCTRKDVIDFLEYMIARPVVYAGTEWKASEVFATWLMEGAPRYVPR
jgi:hypothetical protein